MLHARLFPDRICHNAGAYSTARCISGPARHLCLEERRAIMRSRLRPFIVAAVLAAGLATLADAASQNVFTVKARLFGDATVSGHAVYVEKDRGVQGLERRFKVQIEDAVPGETFDIFVNDFFVRPITADALGRAELQLRTRKFIEEPEDGRPMPPRFPRLELGDVVTVGHLSGVFFDRSKATGKRPQRFRLRGAYVSDSEYDGGVRYLERLRNGRLLRRFKVEVEDAEPGEVFDVHVNGVFVGELVIDDLDEGRLELRTHTFIKDPDDGEPMPRSFPSLVPGDLVEVGPLSVILEAF
jgi:hypothetical protein